jgi:glutamate dehydrogenase/leucine dehydrogenase
MDAARDPRQPEIIELAPVPGFVVFDLPGAAISAGGTRLAPDVTVAEVAPLARAMTYKFAALISAVVVGIPFEDVLTGYGVAVAAETALRAGPGGGWDGRPVAIEGFGKVGGGVARAVTSRGGRVVAVSTVAGCVADLSGLDIDRLLELRRVHGDECVAVYGPPAKPPGPPGQLFTTVAADVVVPGTRPGVISSRAAESLPPGVQVVAPAASVPYTAAGGCERAASFLRGWWGDPPGPPFAREAAVAHS